MDFVTIPFESTSDESFENERSTSCTSSTLKYMAEKMEVATSKVAKERNLDASIVRGHVPPIDICVFGRSGIGKSTLIKAITNMDIPSSAQIDHVTQVLTEASTCIEGFTFRFWDTKGVDSWQDIDSIDNMFNEMSEHKIQPLFVIYCATANGRVDSDIVAGFLKRFRLANILICYVVTNIYAASNSQLDEQIKGGTELMNHVFGTTPQSTGDLCYEYKNTLATINDVSACRNQGILIGVNSCDFHSRLGERPPFNILELMDFLAGNLNDEDFTKFVVLTMANRHFWSRVRDAFRTRVLRVSDTLNNWRIKSTSFFKWLFKLD